MTATQPSRRTLGLVVGLGVTAALGAIDLLLSSSDIVIGAVVLGPLLCAVLADYRDVALVGAFATALCLVSGVWNDNLLEPTWFLRAAVVAVGSLIATLASARGDRVERDRLRFSVLWAAADVGTGTLDLEDTAERLADIIVPAVADVCVVDVASGSELRRLVVRASGPDREDVEARVAAQPASAATQARIVAHGGGSGAVQSTAILPLVARGRTLGTLTLGLTRTSGRTYVGEDLEFARVLAGRVALALDNAGLFAELETIEAQLSAAMSGLAEAVTVQRTAGALVYANDAAARLMGFAGPGELLAAPVAEIIARATPTKEDGSPVTLDDFPGRKVLAGQPAEPLLTRMIDGEGRERWTLTKAAPVHDRHGRVTLVVNVIEDITAVKRSERALRLLSDAGEVLSSSMDSERTLQEVADLAAPELADWCAVSLPDRTGFLRTVGVAHAAPDRLAEARRLGELYPTPLDGPTAPAQVYRTGMSQIVNDIRPEMLDQVAQDAEHARLLRRLGMRAAMIVPLAGRSGVLGVLTLVSAESGRVFSADDQALAEELGRRAGAAVEHARLYTERSRIARTLQSGLLPDVLPAMPGWRARSLYRPANAEEHWVGGDFLDAVPVRRGWLVLVGDVAGHGADAASLTSLARHTLRATGKLLDDPLGAIRRLNAELVGREPLALCTVVAAWLREAGGETVADIVSAGHPEALVVRDGVVERTGAIGPMLGAFDAQAWDRVTVALPQGATLVLFTDGVLDTIGRGGERFGDERLRAALTGARGADDVVARIDAALHAFQVGQQADDTAVLAVERLVVAEEPTVAGQPPAPSRLPMP